MSERLLTELENFEYSLLKTVELAKKYDSPQLQDKKLYEDIIDKIVVIRGDAKIVSDIVQNSGDVSTVAKLDTIILNAKKSKKKSKKTDKHKSLIRQINDILNPSESISNTAEDDDIYMDAEISPIDPITKQLIKDAVKNKICNHRYEKSSILESIKQNPRLRCPMVGCANTFFITKDNLVEDIEFMCQLRRQLN